MQPSTLGLYVELGLHTNSEMVTDKNSQRFILMKVLRRLWNTPSGWAAFVNFAATNNDALSGGLSASLSSASAGVDASGCFAEFATTLVKENIFLLDDALGRSIRDAERAASALRP